MSPQHELSRPSAILLDFDGTICHLFRHTDLSIVGKSARALFAEYGLVSDVPNDAHAAFSALPHLGLNLDSSLAIELASRLDDLLTRIEIQAVPNAPIVPGFARFLEALGRRRIPFGVVTNNSASAVSLFANTRQPELIDIATLGRRATRPDLLKPNPWGVTSLSSRLGQRVGKTTWLIGDSTADVHAGLEAGCTVIGMGSADHKFLRLARLLGEDSVVHDYEELTQRLLGASG